MISEDINNEVLIKREKTKRNKWLEKKYKNIQRWKEIKDERYLMWVNYEGNIWNKCM